MSAKTIKGRRTKEVQNMAEILKLVWLCTLASIASVSGKSLSSKADIPQVLNNKLSDEEDFLAFWNEAFLAA